MMAVDPRATIIGVDVGGTKTAVIEGTQDARTLHRSERPTEGHRPFGETWPQLAEQIAEMIGLARSEGRSPTVISVAVGGPLVAREGRLLDPPNLSGWHGVPLAQRISERFPEFRVHVEHDAKAGALAEFRFGVGASRPSLSDMVFLTFGTGLGAGVIANGQLVRGSSEMAGEVWNLAVTAPAGSRVATCRQWERVASGRGIAELAALMQPGRWPPESATRDVVSAARAGDPHALEVVAECGRWLGSGLGALITILNPQVIVLGTLATLLGDLVLEPAREEVARRAEPRARAACEILAGTLGARLGDVQSLMAAIETLRQSAVKPPPLLRGAGEP